MKNLFKKASASWSAFHELAMAPIAFFVFTVIYTLITMLFPDVPLWGPSRLVGPMFGAFLVFVGWSAGTFSFYWNCKDRFVFLFKSGPSVVFYKIGNDSNLKLTLFNEKMPAPKINELHSLELFRCHVLYLWHCSIFVFGLVLSQ